MYIVKCYLWDGTILIFLVMIRFTLKWYKKNHVTLTPIQKKKKKLGSNIGHVGDKGLSSNIITSGL